MIKLFGFHKKQPESFQEVIPGRAFPNEIVMLIFSFLETEKLLMTCSPVSKSWKWIIDSKKEKLVDYKTLCEKNGWMIPKELLEETFGNYETIAKAPVLSGELQGFIKNHSIGPCQMTAPVQKWKDESGHPHIVGRLRSAHYMVDMTITIFRSNEPSFCWKFSKGVREDDWKFAIVTETLRYKKLELKREVFYKFTNYNLSAKYTSPKRYLTSKERKRLDDFWWPKVPTYEEIYICCHEKFKKEF